MGLKEYALAFVCFVFAVVAAFAAGRWTAPTNSATFPPDVVERIRTVTVTKYVDRVQVITRHIVHTKAPDGTETTTTDERTAERERTKETPPPPSAVGALLAEKPRQWRAGISLGLGGLTFSSPKPTMVLGLEVEHRVIGPLWLGAQGLSSGYIGLTTAVEF